MPLLTFEWDVERDHPIIYKFRSNYLDVDAIRSFVAKRGGCHRSANIVINFFDVTFCKGVIRVSANVLSQSHASYIIDGFFVCL